MSFQVLLSAMFLEDETYVDSLHITSDAVVINQCDREMVVKKNRMSDGKGQEITYVETTQRGLSKSRNMAISMATADICILCDNDVEYVSDYEQIITGAFAEHEDADVIVFYIKRKEKPVPNFSGKRWMDYLSVLKIFSPEIAFRRKSIEEISFDENFGAGAGYIMGEENIFLYECLKKGKKILYLPVQIATLREEESTWFKGYDERFFVSRGANYAAMSRSWSPLLILQFAIRKRALYQDVMSPVKAYHYMRAGRKEYLSKNIRLFLCGDYKTGTGPANVTKAYLKYLKSDTLYLKTTSKISRVLEIFFYTLRADVVLFSGYSRQNILGLRLAKLFSKKHAYLMHGCVEHENGINDEADETMNHVERMTMELSQKIYAVSNQFAEWLKEHYREYADKIDVAVNGIDDTLVEPSGNRDSHLIVSIGGGMPRKRIKVLCRAIELVRKEYKIPLKLVVIGAVGKDSEEINQYSFVENRGLVHFEETKKLLRKAVLFVQNSCFETFGLAPVEALMCGASILCTKQTGAWEIFGEVRETDQILNCEDEREIAEKIVGILQCPNADRLYSEIDKESTSWKARTKQLYHKLTLL